MDKDTLGKFYRANKFFCWLMITTLVVVFVTSVYLSFFCKLSDYSKLGNVWIIASSFITMAYTIWFWRISDNGTDILAKLKLENKKKHAKNLLTIGGVSSILFIVLIFNILMFNKNGSFYVLYNLILMIVTFWIFLLIDKIIEGNHLDPNVVRDFKYAINNGDIPGLISFIILLGFYLVTYQEQMNLFYSGAIAFQMLFISFIWANTDVTDTITEEITDKKSGQNIQSEEQ